jgi:hypothetical protein
MSVQPLNLMVFREGRREICACQLQSHLLDLLHRSDAQTSQEQKLGLLLLAGELECGVADVLASDSGNHSIDFGPELIRLESVTDALARALAGAELQASGLAETLEAIRVPERISVSAPEGFAYYALHPFAYADAAAGLIQNSHAIAVIGIRSIGTTLSAVVVAAAGKEGKKADRITVRPHGHPYNRELRLALAEAAFVDRHMSAGSHFIIVDEGPGLSGSSFLAVAEALLTAGVPREKVTLLCGHQPDFDSLRAENAPHRARQFRWLAVDREPHRPDGAGTFIGGGEWRRLLLHQESAWPAVWISFERLKYRSSSSGACRFYKFLGLGHYGQAVFEREQRVAEAGFGPEPRAEQHGFVSYPLLQGRPMSSSDLNEGVLSRLAEYCAFRGSAFPVALDDLDSLQQMADHNLRELDALQPGFSILIPVTLELRRPVIADGQMQPHEWLLTAGGHMLKTDSGSHGDDHFFPGPTDIAWDLAGVMVEWEMSAEQSAAFLDLYRQKSGDDAVSRIQHFLIAYSVFRWAYCLMAANALGEGEESRRFRLAAEKYKLMIHVPLSFNPEQSEGSLPPRLLPTLQER